MFTDRELLARIIKCEAGGEGDDGMRAVATVVMNRVRATTGEYARVATGGLRAVIFQPRQFDCAASTMGGMPTTYNIYTNEPEQIHFEIADWAMSGGIFAPAGNCLWFYAPYGANCRQSFPSNVGTLHTRINGHCFFRPTANYNNT